MIDEIVKASNRNQETKFLSHKFLFQPSADSTPFTFNMQGTRNTSGSVGK